MIWAIHGGSELERKLGQSGGLCLPLLCSNRFAKPVREDWFAEQSFLAVPHARETKLAADGYHFSGQLTSEAAVVVAGAEVRAMRQLLDQESPSNERPPVSQSRRQMRSKGHFRELANTRLAWRRPHHAVGRRWVADSQRRVIQSAHYLSQFTRLHFRLLGRRAGEQEMEPAMAKYGKSAKVSLLVVRSDKKLAKGATLDCECHGSSGDADATQ